MLRFGLSLVLCFAAFAPLADAAETKPVKVFILSGQSNMEGKAAASTLEAVIRDPKTRDRYKHLKNGEQWAVRNDVFITYLDRQESPVSPLHGPLTVGFGSPKTERDDDGKKYDVPGVGPELGIGWVLGEHFDEPVLLIKAAWGGRAVKYSFRPPSAMPSDEAIRAQVEEIEAKRQAAIEQAEQAKAAGKKFKSPPPPRSFEDHKAGYGSDYRKVISETRQVLASIERYVPNYDKQAGYEIAGFIWS